APLPSASSCAPPLGISPVASSFVCRPRRCCKLHATPSPQTLSASTTRPPRRTLPVIGLFHATATPPVADGCTATQCGGNLMVRNETGLFVELTTSDGGSVSPRKTCTPRFPSRSRTGLSSSLASPKPR